MERVGTEEAARVRFAGEFGDGEAPRGVGVPRAPTTARTGAAAAVAQERDAARGEVDLDALARAHEPHAPRGDPAPSAVRPCGEQAPAARAAHLEHEQADRAAGPATERGSMRGEPAARGAGHAGVSATSRAIQADERVGGAARERRGGGRRRPSERRAGGRRPRSRPGKSRGGRRRRSRAEGGRLGPWWSGGQGRERREEESGARGHLNRSLRHPRRGPGGRAHSRSCVWCRRCGSRPPRRS